MGFLSNRISEESLKPGDHIYSWRPGYVYAHHGIYVGENRVIHFTCGPGNETGMVHSISSSACPVKVQAGTCPDCGDDSKGAGVLKSCLKCFLSGGYLYLYCYSVKRVYNIVTRGGTCTMKNSNPVEEVIRRATEHLRNGFGDYNLLTNNCESFCLSCKTSGMVDDKNYTTFERSGQVTDWNLPIGLLVTAFTAIHAVVGVISLFTKKDEEEEDGGVSELSENQSRRNQSY